jgi:hypothetical protein
VVDRGAARWVTVVLALDVVSDAVSGISPPPTQREGCPVPAACENGRGGERLTLAPGRFRAARFVMIARGTYLEALKATASKLGKTDCLKWSPETARRFLYARRLAIQIHRYLDMLPP